jgi:hypothetical protein
MGGGYIYLIESKYGWKIGKSKSPKKRYSLFAVKLPFKIHLRLVLKVVDYHELEKKLHCKYRELRLNGEWFALNESHVHEMYFHCYFWNREKAKGWDYTKWDKFIKGWDNETLPLT